ncbi:MAG: sulfatase-like hydrolase/transferase, partial [Candidatus Sumerlaeia bacterium]
YTAPHWPLHALPEDIAKYEGRYRQGWDRLRQHRHEELKGTGILESKWDISPRDEKAPAWEDADHPDWQDLRMAVYAAQIDRMDQGVGHIMNTLRKLDIEDNTLVMFLADNGGCAEFLREDGQRGRWPEIYSMPLRDGRVTKVGNNPEKKPGPADTFMSYDLPWANASNSPFRLFKSWVHEGGISTPLIVHWPEVIRESRIVHEPCHVVDIMATCLEVSGAAYPREHNGHEVQPLEGESLAPVFRGEKWQRQNPIYFEHQGNRAIRMGDWKLVNRHPGDWELYNMCEDRTELNDLAAGDADRSRKLRKIWQAWADRCGIVDWPPWR